MGHDLPSWPRLAVAAATVVAVAAGVTGAAVVVGMTDGDHEPGATDVRLVSYDSCDAALGELRDRVLPHVGPNGLGFGYSGAGDGSVAAAEGGVAATDQRAVVPNAPPREEQRKHSTTNTHESDVDEPDLVKTDGRRVVSITDGTLRVVDVASRTETAVARLSEGSATQLLVAGDRALVLTESTMPRHGVLPGAERPTDTFEPGSRLVLVDLTSGATLGTLAVDGRYLDARQVGSVARVVVRSAPRLGFTYPDGTTSTSTTSARNRAVVMESSIGDWLPRYSLTVDSRTTSGQLVDCASVSHPTEYTGTAMLTVLTVDLGRDLGVGDPVTLVADGNTVYGTGSSLYVADDHLAHGMSDMPVPVGDEHRTDVYQFDISGGGKPVHVASGSVDGTLLNQYSLSEHEGNLRVATTRRTAPAATATTDSPPATESAVTVLTRRGAELARVGRVGGLGVGERIYSVRFMGDVGYVVTFRETDPLYTVDLSDPANPRVTGELKIPGYSAYLHPAGDGRLIGVGQDATSTGRRTGVQVSLFDTTNPAGASRVAQYHLEEMTAEVEFDPHAFLYWPETGLVVLPVLGGWVAESPEKSVQQGGALVLRLSGDTFTEVGRLSHPVDENSRVPPRRALVIGTELWTVSEAGMLVTDLDALTTSAWLPFAA